MFRDFLSKIKCKKQSLFCISIISWRRKSYSSNVQMIDHLRSADTSDSRPVGEQASVLMFNPVKVFLCILNTSHALFKSRAEVIQVIFSVFLQDVLPSSALRLDVDKMEVH